MGRDLQTNSTMSWHIREAVRRIAAGGVIAYPTETVYGLGCDPFNGPAVLRLLKLKQRDIDQGVILIASEFAQLEPLLCPLSSAAWKRVTGNTARPVTWVLPCPVEIPVWLRGAHTSLAVRITRHPIARALCDRWGVPLVSTSANLHGRRPATAPHQVRRAFSGQLDYLLHGPVGANGRPSQIRDGLTGEILRS
jgi:L-threonylcarbamoyladenylate synthase